MCKLDMMKQEKDTMMKLWLLFWVKAHTLQFKTSFISICLF